MRAGERLALGAATTLVLGVTALIPLGAHAVTGERTVPVSHPTVGSSVAAVPHVELPGCALAEAADDDAANCDGGDHLIYRERRWVDADAPRVTAEHILMVSDSAYLQCAPGYEHDPDAGPCWHPATKAEPFGGIVNGDEDEPLDQPIVYLPGYVAGE